ncbi:MAG: divergent polysaccharide deacetylase family protein [Gammaproteobacteria bacterium]|nr:divergent polysaccharide deacetylase family protein [Gammaproteobacteria bacterium]
MTLRLTLTLLLVISTIKPGLASDAKFGFERPSPTNTQQPLPAVSIIIDDLGEQLALGERAIALPGEITYAFLPHTSHAVHLAELAHQQNREVMIHIPMQPVGDNSLGKGGLTLDMSQQNFIATLKDNLNAIPHISGINNHMGSLLTQHPGKMAWLMQTLSEEHDDLFFVDSRTTEHTVAYIIAAEFEIPRINRNVFLDNIRTEKEIGIQFKRLLALAKRHGTAVAIGHPYPETLKFLEQMLPALQQQGIELIKTSSLIKRKHLLETTILDTMLAAKESHNKMGLPHAAESRSLIQ